MNVKTALAAVLLTLAPSPGARADYSVPPAKDFVLASDLIVAGTISALGAETFTLRVESHIAGAPQNGSIEVQRFEDWMCAGRWAPYATGQRVLLFLRAHAGDWRILSAGGEGEMPIVDDMVYVGGLYDIAPVGAPMQRYEVYGGATVAFATPFSAFTDLLRQTRACFRGQQDQGHVARVRAVCSADAMATLRSSALGARLADAMLR